MRLKITPLLFNIVIIAYLISNCGNSPVGVANKGQLQMRISFAEEINKASILGQSAVIDRMTVEVSNSKGRVVASSDLTKNGIKWEASIELDPADDLTVIVKASENSVLRYAGSSSGVDIQAGETERVEFTLSSHFISDIRLIPPSPDSLLFNQRVNVTFEYLTNQAGDVEIYAGAARGGSEIPITFLFFDQSPRFLVGNGPGEASFLIKPGFANPLHVGQIILKMFPYADTSRVLYEASVSVEYTFSSQ